MQTSFISFLTESDSNGVYVAVTFAMQTVNKIVQLQELYNIPNPLDSENFHATIVYSRAPMRNFDVIEGFSPPKLVASTAWIETWEFEDNKGVIILRLDSPWLESRHKFLYDSYGGTYDFPEYKPHITLSYNYDGRRITTPKFPLDVFITKEYKQATQVPDYAK